MPEPSSSGIDPSAIDLSVVIVTHQTRGQVRDCLQSLYADGGLRGLRAQVILIDNASTDGTVEMARTEFPQVHLIASDENLGFTRGNNAGIAVATGRNVLLLNPDTIVPDGALAKCVAFLDGQPDDVAAMTCRVHLADGSLQPDCARRLPSPWVETCRALLLDRLFPKSDLFNPEWLVRWDKSDARPVPCIVGAFMLMRREVVEKLGGLDERFFLMYEDTDYCKRLGDGGYKIWYWPDAHIVHLKGQWTKQQPMIAFANSQVSALIYFRKHHPRSVWWLRIVMRLGMEMKIGLLRLNALRRPNDEYTRSHLEMARAARATLKTGQPIRYGGWA